MTFKEFNLKASLFKGIEKAGFVEPSPIQKEAIPVVLDGKDIVAQAQTGTGKTAAFGLPILQNMSCKGGVETLVVVPTRELAMQVSDELYKFGKFLDIKTATVYGGTSYDRQIKHIKNASIIIATPGRLLDLLKGGKINIAPKYVVLDEADEMLDMGFLDDIKAIFKFMPEKRQTLLFSATMPKPIKELAKTILIEPTFITITKTDVTNKNISQSFYIVEEYERDDALMRLFDYKNPTKSIVFCKMKRDVDRLATYLVSQGFSAKGLHGDMEQRQREEVIKAFKTGNLEVLIATDVAARGLDVNDVSHVFNYQLPYDSEPYVHRIGRTGRGGKTGVAVSIVTPSEFRSLKKIQDDTKGVMEAKVVPTALDVKKKNKSALAVRMRDQKIDEHVIDLIEELKAEFDLSTIAYKLASILADKEKVKGRNNIGKSADDLAYLLERLAEKRSGGKGNSRRRDSRRRGGRSSNRSHNGQDRSSRNNSNKNSSQKSSGSRRRRG